MTMEMEPAWIDPTELPFTEEELFRAFALIQTEREARKSARYVARVVRQSQRNEEAARSARERGSQDVSQTIRPVWAMSADGFALLALLSDDLRLRVETYLRTRWEADRSGLIRDHLYRPNGTIVPAPTPEILAEIDEVIADYESEWSETLKQMRAEVQRRRRGDP